MQSLKTYLTLYLRTHQYVDCELFFLQGYQCLWVDRGLCVSTAASPAATYKPATAAGEKKKEKEKERELVILNGLYKNHTFGLLPDYSNSFFVLAVNPLYRSNFNHEWLLSFSFVHSLFVQHNLWLMEDVFIMCACYVQQLNMPLGHPVIFL